MMIFDFMVSRSDAGSGIWLFSSLMVSVVIGWEFTMASTSSNYIYSDSSPRLFPCVFISAMRINLAVLICLSQMEPMWLVAGGFQS